LFDSENNFGASGFFQLSECITRLTKLQSLELTQTMHSSIESATTPVGGCLELVRSAHGMTQLKRLNLRGNDINVNSRKVIMELERVKEGTMQVVLSPCLVYVDKPVQCSEQDMENYLGAGCCVYCYGYDPAYSERKLCASSLVPIVVSKDVRILGKGEIDFFYLNLISTVLGECYCPAGSKGY
jgi:hypothetical protein